MLSHLRVDSNVFKKMSDVSRLITNYSSVIGHEKKQVYFFLFFMLNPSLMKG